MMKYAYTSRVRPILSYCAFAFRRHLTRCNLAKLKKVQRLALLMTGSYRQNTSGDSLDVLTDTIPIDLFLREETLKAGTRLNKHFELSWVGESLTTKIGLEEEISKELKSLDLLGLETDDINQVTILKKRNFTITTDSGGSDYEWGYRMYTDGSKNKHGVGAGICYMRDEEILIRDNIGLPPRANIFQAELKAIELACETLFTHPIYSSPYELVIFSDSLSSLQALAAPDIKNKIVLDTLEALNDLGRVTRLELRWIKAHNNYKGNEVADQEAKLGTLKPFNSHIPLPKREIHNRIRENTTKRWKDRYQKLIKSRTLELLVPEPDPSLAEQLLKLSRNDISLAVQYLTGHNFLLHHEKQLKTGEARLRFLNSKCRLCNRQEETTQHMLFECDALAVKRADTLGKYFIDPERDQLDILDVIAFLKSADLANKPIPEGHLTNLNPPTI